MLNKDVQVLFIVLFHKLISISNAEMEPIVLGTQFNRLYAQVAHSELATLEILI